MIPGKLIYQKIELNHPMEIIEVTDPVGKDDFSVRKFIKAGENHYVEIRPKQNVFRIKISSTDYHKALRAHYSSKSINCYPLKGYPEDGIFEEVVYEMIIE